MTDPLRTACEALVLRLRSFRQNETSMGRFTRYQTEQVSKMEDALTAALSARPAETAPPDDLQAFERQEGS